MSTLEDAIRAAAKTGRLHGLTLFSSSQVGWQGNARWNGSEGWTVEHHADPVEALLAALASTTRFDHTRTAAPAEPASEVGVFD